MIFILFEATQNWKPNVLLEILFILVGTKQNETLLDPEFCVKMSFIQLRTNPKRISNFVAWHFFQGIFFFASSRLWQNNIMKHFPPSTSDGERRKEKSNFCFRAKSKLRISPQNANQLHSQSRRRFVIIHSSTALFAFEQAIESSELTFKVP